MAEEQENTGENTEITLDEKYRLFANKYQIVVSDDSGKLLTMQHPFPTVQECEEEIGKIHQRHPNHEIYWDGELKMKWTKTRSFLTTKNKERNISQEIGPELPRKLQIKR